MIKASKIIEYLRGNAAIRLSDLISYWKVHDPAEWETAPEIYKLICQKAIHIGEPILACDIIREFRAKYNDPEADKLHANALIQSGAYHSAIEILDGLTLQGICDFQTFSLNGRALKRIWTIGSRDPKNPIILRALKYYATAYAFAKKHKNHNEITYSGINTATLLCVINERENALKFASEVARYCLQAVKQEKPPNYWTYATLGEVAVIENDLKLAREYYQKAVALARENLNSVIVMRKQIRFLLYCCKHLESSFDDLFPIPNVACITGHIVDPPDASFERLPEAILNKIEQRIASEIIKRKVEIGFSSALWGADLLFADELLKRNAEVNIILPCPPDRFKKTITNITKTSFWHEKFDRVIAKASNLIELNTELGNDDQAPFNYCSQMVDGLAFLRSNSIGADLIHLAIWDGRSEDDIPGTAKTVERWQSQRRDLTIIKTTDLFSRNLTKGLTVNKNERSDQVVIANKQDSVAILFADTVEYSLLSEREIPLYVEHFLGTVALVIEEMRLTDTYRNTWGDGLFMVFQDTEIAAEFSLRLCEKVLEIAWRHKGLPERLSFRAALHAGPAYKLFDPITQRYHYYGFHISKGARIEPITPPGQVYASENFAALITANRCERFSCDYVGRVPHAKGYGTYPLYHLIWRKNYNPHID